MIDIPKNKRSRHAFFPLWLITTVLLVIMMSVLMSVIYFVPENISSVRNSKLFILTAVMIVEIILVVLILHYMVAKRVMAFFMLLTEDVLIVAGDPVSFEHLRHHPLLGVREITQLQIAIEKLYCGISEELQRRGIIPNISYGDGVMDSDMNMNQQWYETATLGTNPGSDGYDEPSCEYYSLNKYLQSQNYRNKFRIRSFLGSKSETGAWNFGVLNRFFTKGDSHLSASGRTSTDADFQSLCSSPGNETGLLSGMSTFPSGPTSTQDSNNNSNSNNNNNNSGVITVAQSEMISINDNERGKKNEYDTRHDRGTLRDEDNSNVVIITPLSSSERLVCDPLDDNSNHHFEVLAQSLRLEGAIIIQILKSLRVGRSLSSVTLPVQILESRSLLELLSDMFVSWDLLLPLAVRGEENDIMHPVDRMRVMLRWFFAAYHWRPKGISKKPYNPILGEVFLCECPAPMPADIKPVAYTSEFTTIGKNNDNDNNDNNHHDNYHDRPSVHHVKTSLGSMRFIAEQVCHRPPVSVFYAEVPGLIIAKGVFIPQSKLVSINCAASISCSSILVRFPQTGWSYRFSLPNVYASGVVAGTPRLELGGVLQLNDCHSQTCATVKFLRKGFFGGKFDEVIATISAEDGVSTAEEYAGVWHSAVYPRLPTTTTTTTTKTIKTTTKGKSEKEEEKNEAEKEEVNEKTTPAAAAANIPLFDPDSFQRLRGMPCHRPHACPLNGGHPKQSRAVWRELTAAIRRGDVEAAARAKFAVEEAQRDERRQMAEEERQHQPQFFRFVGNGNIGIGNEAELGKEESWEFTGRDILFR